AGLPPGLAGHDRRGAGGAGVGGPHASRRCAFACCRRAGSPLCVSAREGVELDRHREAWVEAPARLEKRVGKPVEAGLAEGHGVDARLGNPTQERERTQRLEADAEPDAVTDRVDVASLGRSGAGALRDFSRELPLREVDAAVALPHVARRDSRSEASADGELRAPVEQSREADPGTRLIAGIEFAELAGQREAEPAEVVPQPHAESLDDADGA